MWLNPVKASMYNGCGRCGDLLIWRAPKPSLTTYPSGEVCLFLWSLLALIIWAPVWEPTVNIMLLKLNHFYKLFFLLLHFSVLIQQLLSSDDYIFFLRIVFCILSLGIWHRGLPRWLSVNEPACQCRRRPFDPWVRNVPWRRKWPPTPVFLPGESQGWRSLVGYSPWGCKRI